MKKMILSVVVMLFIGVSSTFANRTENVNQKAQNSFSKDFAAAKEVKWESTKEFSKVTFTLNAQVMTAYYNTNGEMIAITRNIVSGQLPISLLTSLKKDYSEFWISDLFEMAAENSTTYYVTLENADTQLVLRSDSNGNWELFKKERK